MGGSKLGILTVITALSILYAGNFSTADVGTAVSYGPPYLPTACYGNDASKLPPGNLFVAASDAIWDNNAACGRQYEVSCLSGTNQRSQNPCKEGSIVVKIVDHCRSDCQDTMELSSDAFADIAEAGAGTINIEYNQA